MCGAEALLFALKLSLAVVEEKHEGLLHNTRTAICGCDCAVDVASMYSCLASEASAKQRAEKDHNNKVKELRMIGDMCLK